MPSQDALRHALAHRVAEAAAGPGRAIAVPSGEVDLDALAATAGQAPDTTAVAVLRRFDAAAFARSALAFAAGLDEAAGDEWFRAYTRTVFLVGNPANLGRFPFAAHADDGSVGWLGPGPAAAFLGLRRLLKLYAPDAAPEPPGEIALRVPGRGVGRTLLLEVATAGVSTGDYLVHVNHIIAEAVLTRTVGPGDRLLLRHVPVVADGPSLRLRVQRDAGDPSRLRAYARLSTMDTENAHDRRLQHRAPGSAA
ncbi:DUF6182 family protein [Actinokineospora sp. 24-640]